MELQRDIATGPQAPAESRRFVDSLADHIPASVLDDARLVTSELVTNSVKHAGNPPGHPIEVTLVLRPDRLRLAVVDGSVFDPKPESSRELREIKWGLTIVEGVADAWGRVDPPEGGIWAEFRLQPSQ
jgi:anti-sigma regulatory factor (Ser/Thr protein kinase)